jgi:hypothetical protein
MHGVQEHLQVIITLFHDFQKNPEKESDLGSDASSCPPYNNFPINLLTKTVIKPVCSFSLCSFYIMAG